MYMVVRLAKRHLLNMHLKHLKSNIGSRFVTGDVNIFVIKTKIIDKLDLMMFYFNYVSE